MAGVSGSNPDGSIQSMSIQYLEGDATRPPKGPPSIIAHICNDQGKWGKGFVLALSERWREPEQSYRVWYHKGTSGGFRLGALQVVPIEVNLWVANMVAQRDIRWSDQGPPIRYAALREALQQLAQEATLLEASVHMPRIGCGLAGGSWDKIEPLIQETLCEAQIPVFVYNIPGSK